jgi:hypothetical protein
MHKTKPHEVGGRTLIDDILKDKLRKEENEWRTETWFGRHKEVMEQICKILSDLKASGQKEFVINEVGPGRDRKKGYVTYEIFEIINQADRAGITPEELTIHIYDRVMPSLLAVWETKRIILDKDDQSRVNDPSYITEFFSDHQRVEGEKLIIYIDMKWKRSIHTFHEDLKKLPAEIKADVTFACLQVENHEIDLKNLVESTKKGGFIICNPVSEDDMRRLNLERIFDRDYTVIYRRC